MADKQKITKNPEVKSRWRRLGSGTLTLKTRKTIQPGKEFDAKESDIPPGAMDVVELLEDGSKKKSSGKKSKGKGKE